MILLVSALTSFWVRRARNEQLSSIVLKLTYSLLETFPLGAVGGWIVWVGGEKLGFKLTQPRG